MIPLLQVLGGAAAAGGPVFSDNFNRANGGLGANWVEVVYGAPLAIADNAATASLGSGACSSRPTTATPTSDMYAQATITTVASTSIGVMARVADSGETGYLWRYNGSNSTRLLRGSGGSYTALGTAYDAALTAPVTLRIEVSGSTIRGYINGVLRQEVTDTGITTGTKAGLRMASTADRMDNFEMGTL